MGGCPQGMGTLAASACALALPKGQSAHAQGTLWHYPPGIGQCQGGGAYYGQGLGVISGVGCPAATLHWDRSGLEGGQQWGRAVSAFLWGGGSAREWGAALHRVGKFESELPLKKQL